MIKSGVIGHPISHSKSPIIHGYWLKKYGIAGEYQTYDITPENLKDGIQKLIDDGVVGFNVTLPHKQKIQDFCGNVSDAAQKIGAVNTVVIDKNRHVFGDNTDAFGFVENLQTTLPDFNWAGKKALVIGAGGAARAVLYALYTKGVSDICITNRTDAHAIALAGQYHADYCQWQNKQSVVQHADIIINTTSLGMVGQPPLDLSFSGLKDGTVAYDRVYTPLLTDFLCQAKQSGAEIITGIGMLLHQARPGFRSWFGLYPEVTDELRGIL